MSYQRQVIVFLNPRAGRGAGPRLIDELVERMRNEGMEVHQTSSIDALRALVAAHRDSLDAIVCAGGDGTAVGVGTPQSAA